MQFGERAILQSSNTPFLHFPGVEHEAPSEWRQEDATEAFLAPLSGRGLRGTVNLGLKAWDNFSRPLWGRAQVILEITSTLRYRPADFVLFYCWRSGALGARIMGGGAISPPAASENWMRKSAANIATELSLHRPPCS